MMNRWQRLFEGIKTEIKVFIFFSALLTAFRIVFLAVFQSQLASVTMENILTSLWLGRRFFMFIGLLRRHIGAYLCTKMAILAH